MLVNTSMGFSLQRKLSMTYRYSRHILISGNYKPESDTIMSHLKGVDKDTSWTKKNFNGTVTMAALSTLSKMQSVCLNAELKCQKELKSKIIKK
jgi:hypothetical protein